MPGPYPYSQILAVDPSNPSMVASGGSILLFAPGDATQAPVVIWDLTHTIQLPNPVTVNSLGFGPAFLHDTLDQVAWEGGGLTGTFESYRGMRDAADAAAGAAQASADSASAAASNAAGAVDAALSSAVSNAQSAADSAATSAALVNAPADTVTAALVGNPATATGTALNAAYGTLKAQRRTALIAVKKVPVAPSPGDLTFSFIQTSASAITSPVTYQGNDTTVLRFSSCGYGAPQNPAGGSFMGPRARSASGGDNWGTNVVDFNVNTTGMEYLFQFIQGTTGYGRVFIDDALAYSWAGKAYVADQYWTLTITPPIRRSMHVRVETNMGTRTIKVGQNDTLWLPKKPLYTSRWYFKGDSWTAGAQDPSGRSYLPILAERLGVEGLRGGYSSTGYTTNGGGASGKLSFPDSVVPDIAPQSPNVVVIFGSINDASNVAGLQTAAKATYDLMAANLPNIPVIVVGPQYGMYSGPSIATCDAMETALKAAVAVCPNVVGYISTKGWVTGNGKVDVASTSTPKGNCEFFTAQDGIHPTQLGHEWLADRLYGEITALLATLPIGTSAV